ncbi:alpha/beta hydrolase fold domain-containing protein [Sebaldella sp. S0638]|uniref:alpha/beta hydrolase fold domain-containing protein n=1 Tax=Sebaldella sp. S0638 TaxID=2957809 RepID=UPI00209E7225|nr:alpha/beta hydrolase fold domain-containing protein [Sebaldella sp. S0638]MCP1225318.1 alpha/beta hydrolase [Sebaldella sp. S0638]
MISKEAVTAKEKLFQNKNLEDVINTPLKIQREEWEESAGNVKLPENVKIEEVIIRDIKADWIIPEFTESEYVIFYFHGGGLNQGSKLTHRKLVSEIANRSKLRLFIHNYPLAPENPYPEALNKSLEIYLQLLKSGIKAEKIILGSDSSGSALALALILLLKQKKYSLPKAAFLFSPMLDFSLSGVSVTNNEHLDPKIFKEDLELTSKYYCDKKHFKNPMVSPIYGDFSGFPPLFIQVGSEELLLSDSLTLKEKASNVNVPVKLEIWEGMWHVFQTRFESIPEADQALNNTVDFINTIKAEA